jgi:hypothetical protein
MDRPKKRIWLSLGEVMKRWERAVGLEPQRFFDLASLRRDPAAHSLIFDDDAEALTPTLGGKLTISVPRVATYASPMHYVEAMKLLAPSTANDDSRRGEANAAVCRKAHGALAALLKESAHYMRGAVHSCDAYAVEAGFLDPAPAECSFFFSLWIALWAKYSGDAEYRRLLASTGSKMLLYDSGKKESLYGVYHDENAVPSGYRGLNAVGIMLVVLRHLAKDGLLQRQFVSPSDMYGKVMLPVLLEITRE